MGIKGNIRVNKGLKKRDKKVPPKVILLAGLNLTRHWSTLPTSCPVSTIDAGGLNFRIRNGNGCGPSANSTEIILRNALKRFNILNNT